MKITAQLMPGMYKPASPPNRQDIFFDTLVNSPARENKGDDYYWQHQNQLEQSALTFSPLVMKRVTKPLPELPVHSKACTVNQPKADSGTQPNLKPCIEAEQMIIKTSSSAMPPSVKTSATLKQLFEQTILVLESKLRNTAQDSTCTKPASANPVLANTVIFKNHHLFVDNHFAELTLNTLQLSKDETKALQQLIKQWLGRKGIILKQFIINGDLQ